MSNELDGPIPQLLNDGLDFLLIGGHSRMYLSNSALDEDAADQAKALARGLQVFHRRQNKLMLMMI